MQLKPLKRAPVVLALVVLAFICGLRWVQPDLIERLEWMTYDLRVRAASHFAGPIATNIAFVSIEESSIDAVKKGYLDSDRSQKIGLRFNLYWPRQVYGRVVDELSAQGANTVGFDVLFNELRTADHAPVQMADGALVESDDYFAMQMHRADRVILADSGEALLPDLFVTNAMTLGDITSEKDADGVLRRVKAFRRYRHWHPIFQKAADGFDLDLAGAKIVPGRIILLQNKTTNTVEVPVDADNNFNLSDFDQRRSGKARAFTDERTWQMGIVMAAKEIGASLDLATVDLAHGKIVLHGARGIDRTIPVDGDGYLYIDWRLLPNDPHLARAPVEDLLRQNYLRLAGETNGLSDPFRSKLVFIGSAAQGNDLTDRGATPLERDTLLVSQHWNVANSVLTGRFVYRSPLSVDLALILLLGGLTAFLTWQLRVFSATGGTLLVAVLYTAATFFVFVRFRVWLPLVLPLAGAMLMEHLMLIAYRVVFEEGEKRRVKSVFSRIVAPDIVNELLHAKKLSLGGGRREVTVYFADVRGFTEFTDLSQAKVLEYIRAHNLSGADADEAVNQEARETLNTVNLYLGTLADIIKRYNGTLDKYIGDCVMAFWGAPVANEKHAVACVRAAIDAQRAIYQVNLQRVAENHKRELENLMGASPVPKPKLPILTLGSGINTGMVTVGLMGSNEHLLNYTVFGREVNLASRLEAVSGRGRIVISDATFQHVLRDDPELAKTFVALPPVKVKGIISELKIYEVPWRPAEASPFDEEVFSSKPSEGTSFTGIVQRE